MIYHSKPVIPTINATYVWAGVTLLASAVEKNDPLVPKGAASGGGDTIEVGK